MKYYKQSGNTIETIETSRPEEMHIELFGQKLLKADKPIQHYIDTGEILQPENTKLIGNEFVYMTEDELIKSGKLTIDEYNDRQESRRKSEYQNTTDPIFFKFQRGEATEKDWKDSIKKVKDKFPKKVK